MVTYFLLACFRTMTLAQCMANGELQFFVDPVQCADAMAHVGKKSITVIGCRRVEIKQ